MENKKRSYPLPDISPRLKEVSRFVRDGACVADVGTDHAYLPIYLLKKGVARYAVATDVREGPLVHTRDNVDFYKVSDKVAIYRTDGLVGIEKYSPDDIMICGMGGELILRIVTECDYTRKAGVRLLLQPMSSFAELRQGLSQSGYTTEAESLVRDGHMIYQVIVCTYTGEKYTLSSAQLLLGPENIRENSELFKEYAAIHLRKLERKIESKGGAGYDVSADIELAKEIRNILKTENTEDVKNGDSI